MKKRYEKAIIIVILFISIILIPNISSLSNESIQAEKELRESKELINNLQKKDIPIKRVNETYTEALQVFYAQRELEKANKNANYNVVIEKTQEIKKITEKAEKAKDELLIFNKSYFDAKKDTNLSEMQEDYEKIINSFKDERFEETPKLINKGYEQLSEIQSSQTTVNLFYSTTSKTIENFIKDNWKLILIIFSVIILLLFIFQRTISRFMIRKKLNHLYLRKKTINNMIKENQKNYFKKGKISKEEYDLKTKKFNEILRDIERQIPLLKEKKARVKKKKK